MAEKRVLRWNLSIPVEVEYEMIFGKPSITSINLLVGESETQIIHKPKIPALTIEGLREECIRAVEQHVKEHGE